MLFSTFTGFTMTKEDEKNKIVGMDDAGLQN